MKSLAIVCILAFGAMSFAQETGNQVRLIRQNGKIIISNSGTTATNITVKQDAHQKVTLSNTTQTEKTPSKIQISEQPNTNLLISNTKTELPANSVKLVKAGDKKIISNTLESNNNVQTSRNGVSSAEQLMANIKIGDQKFSLAVLYSDITHVAVIRFNGLKYKGRKYGNFLVGLKGQTVLNIDIGRANVEKAKEQGLVTVPAECGADDNVLVRVNVIGKSNTLYCGHLEP